MARAQQALEVMDSRSLAREDFVLLWIDKAYVLTTYFVLCMGATIEEC